MKSIVKTMAAILMTMAFSSAMAAQGGFDQKNLFFGGGLSQNDVSGSDNGTGFQFFGGYQFGDVANNVKLDAEVGYMTTGNMCVNVPILGCVDAKAKGLWATGVVRFALNPQFELVGRAGLDFGDDDGFMFGVGLGYHLNKQSTLRFEIVERDNVSSLQFNFVYRP